MIAASAILGDQVGSTAPVFLAFLAVHVLAGLTAVVAGAAAALARKGSPRHVRAGRLYYRAITVVFATATALAIMRWRQDYDLLIIGAAASPPQSPAFRTGAATAPATPATSPQWAPHTWPCSPRSTSTTDPTSPCGTTCRPCRSGSCPQSSERP